MIVRLLLAVCVVFGTIVAAAPAEAERLIVSVSNHRVTVTPNYSGEELVLFGSIERDASTPPGRTSYDLVVTVSGPRADMVTRRKARRFGIWINTDYRQFLQVPTYLAVFANRPLDDIAPAEVQRRQQLGLNNMILTQRVGTDYADVVPNDPFRRAFVRLQEQHGLYREDTSAVTFLTPTLFRTGIPLPAQAVLRRHVGDANRNRVRDRQGRLRAVRREHRPAERICLWAGDGGHGADDRLDGVDRVQEGLIDGHPFPFVVARRQSPT
jgi:uncharacterized protein (TIGR02186 family)